MARGDNVRVTVPEHAVLDAIADLDVEVVTADVARPARACAGRCAASTASSTWPVATTLRAGWRDLYQANVIGTRIALEEALRAGVQRVVHTSTIAAHRPAPRPLDRR